MAACNEAWRQNYRTTTNAISAAGRAITGNSASGAGANGQGYNAQRGTKTVCDDLDRCQSVDASVETGTATAAAPSIPAPAPAPRRRPAPAPAGTKATERGRLARPSQLTLYLAIKSAAGSLLIPGASGAGTAPSTSFCFPPDSM